MRHVTYGCDVRSMTESWPILRIFAPLRTCKSLKINKSEYWELNRRQMEQELARQRTRKCVAVCCSVLQCVAVSCCESQWAAVSCSVLQCVAVASCESLHVRGHVRVLQCVAVCCNVLQCVAVSCSVLQYVAVCCCELQWVAVSCSINLQELAR